MKETSSAGSKGGKVVVRIEQLKGQDIGIKIIGEVDICTVDEFRAAIEALIDHGGDRIVLDLTEMDYIDSTGIGILIELRKKSIEKEQETVLYGAKKNVVRLLDLTGVSQIFKMVEREER